jgi:hypothetical protein
VGGTFTEDRFDPASLAAEPEPVRRYLAHAIREGAALAPALRLTMKGRIRVGAWLPFTAVEELDGRSFSWRARVGFAHLPLLEVEDGFGQGKGATSGRLVGRIPLFDAHDPDTARSAAGRAALEAFWAPVSLLPSHGVAWRAEGESAIVAAIEVPPERTELRLEIDEHGAVRSAVGQRWGNADQDEYGYIPCGGSVEAERSFGDLTLPSRVTVGWWFGTPRYAPFFRAEILEATPG